MNHAPTFLTNLCAIDPSKMSDSQKSKFKEAAGKIDLETIRSKSATMGDFVAWIEAMLKIIG